MSETMTMTEAPAPRRATSRMLLVICAQPTEAMRAAIAAGQEPRRDYDALRDVLDADVLHPDDARATRIGALLARRLGPPAASPPCCVASPSPRTFHCPIRPLLPGRQCLDHHESPTA